MGQMLSGMFGACQLPMDTLQRTMSSGSVFPGDFLQGFKPDVEKVTDKFLSVPGIGYSRESQEQVQNGLRLLANYQRSSHEYHVQLGKVGIDALDIMKQRILEMAENGEEINSLREVYDLWVDCNESAYADYVKSEEYSRLYGKLVNDLMALKRHGQGIMDETMSALGMPTRKGMATVQKRQQELRRSLIDSKNRIETLESELKKVEALEHEVKAMRSGREAGSSAGVKTDTAPKSAGKKKAGKKKAGKKKTGKKKAGKKKTGKKKTGKKKAGKKKAR
ncbi:MAG: class III poly(R)-hydroxyalkanoic acid synthase subunit PhaE [Gammaproteobacteria bacterium]|nr:class III poly(R)-hydroxyalkanoic acid synthase subunit PhaE [Gammaproteobacteria bacterium]